MKFIKVVNYVFFSGESINNNLISKIEWILIGNKYSACDYSYKNTNLVLINSYHFINYYFKGCYFTDQTVRNFWLPNEWANCNTENTGISQLIRLWRVSWFSIRCQHLQPNWSGDRQNDCDKWLCLTRLQDSQIYVLQI